MFKLSNLGLFSNGLPKAIGFAQATLIYGENGRGKSTISATLHACSLNDGGRLSARKTLDGTADPEVGFIWQDGPKQTPVRFVGGAWINPTSEILVFDSEFVEENVYSGQEVRAEQRQSLLEFALGDNSITLKKLIDELTSKLELATRKRSEAEKVLSRAAPQSSAAKLAALNPSPSAEADLAALKKRIDAARNIAGLAQRASPQRIEIPAIDLPAFLEMLNTTFEGVEASAERRVREHLVSHAAMSRIETWLSHGLANIRDEKCPFCDQPIAGLALISAYRTYFNQAYLDLKDRIDSGFEDVRERLSVSQREVRLATVMGNSARVESWKDQVEVIAPEFPGEAFGELCEELRQLASDLGRRKKDAPLERIGTREERERLTATSEALARLGEKYNSTIDLVNQKIADFKEKLEKENLIELEQTRREFELAVVRQRPDVVAAISDYVAADAERTILEREKTATRAGLDALMQQTLEQYQNRINESLLRFGAGFSIEQMTHNYVGRTGDPRAEYGLVLRKKPLRLGAKGDSGPHFGTVLSEGDKRTLAFAFFVAKVESDSNALKGKVIVLDDPISSFDRNRRAQTVEVIARLATSSKQVVVLSHDAYFIRDLRAKLEKLKPQPVDTAVCGIKRVKDDYSEIGPCDVGELCASDYYRHYRMVAEYVEGTFTGNMRDAAKAVRPMLGVLRAAISKGDSLGHDVRADHRSNEECASWSPLVQRTALRTSAYRNK